MARNSIYRYLDTDGDGTGTKNANGNYATTADTFYFSPSGQAKIARIIVSYTDAGGMTAQEYGNLGSALSNGITVQVSDDSGVIIDLTDGVPITTNAEWGRLCYDVDIKSWGAGNDLVVVRWTFEKSGDYLDLDGNDGDKLEVVLNDDFSGLVDHYFFVQGQYA